MAQKSSKTGLLKNLVSARYQIVSGPVVDIKTGKEIKPGSRPPQAKHSPAPKGSFKAFKASVQEHTSLSLSSPEDGVIDVDEMININMEYMEEQEYAKMEKDIKGASKKGKGYDVYCWNDESGYDYWKEEGGSGQYIQITCKVDAKKADPKEVAGALDFVHGKVEHWGWD